MELGVFSAVIEFNDGCSGILQVLEKLNLSDGNFIKRQLQKNDQQRINCMEKKSNATGILRRKKLRAIRKGYTDKEAEAEPKPAYSKGDY